MQLNTIYTRMMEGQKRGRKSCSRPLHLRLCRVKLVAMFLGASDCFSLFLQCNIIGKDNLSFAHYTSYLWTGVAQSYFSFRSSIICCFASSVSSMLRNLALGKENNFISHKMLVTPVGCNCVHQCNKFCCNSLKSQVHLRDAREHLVGQHLLRPFRLLHI